MKQEKYVLDKDLILNELRRIIQSIEKDWDEGTWYHALKNGTFDTNFSTLNHGSHGKIITCITMRTKMLDVSGGENY